MFSVPPRHGKTETILHYIAWYLLRNPTHKIFYATYNLNIARKMARTFRDIADRVGLTFRKDSKAVDYRQTHEGGCVMFTSASGTITGLGCHVLIVDDPHKDRRDAESSTERENVHTWYHGTSQTRLEPNGSIIIVHTRWHPDDLIGRLSGDNEWTYTNLPALDEDDNALWPERFSAERLKGIRDKDPNQYEWASLYQGEPRPRGGAIFRDVVYYEGLPNRLKVGIGVDFAYTAKTYSDYSVAVVLGEAEGVFYVLNVIRVQVEAPEFGAIVKALQTSYPGAPTFAFVGGVERGVVDFLRQRERVRIIAQPARGDKFVRAQPVAAAWNRGQVCIPHNASWTELFTSEVLNFTGAGDLHDDQVDALTGAYAALTLTPASLDVFNEVLKVSPKALSGAPWSHAATAPRIRPWRNTPGSA